RHLLDQIFHGWALAAQEKKPSTNSPLTSAASSTAKKGLSETTCDGALDIVPSQTASFTRKRRPVRVTTAEPKTEKKTDR
ncbi:MAG: hypothetical protein ABI882_13495, partial [Acidobacteriota bacterium]